ncbi:MAG: uncharacterized protein QOE63_766 [Acidimicrobiaceae bacterium]
MTGPISIGLSPARGRGVFATTDLEPDEVIERCPLLIVPADEAVVVCGTILGHYAYGWDDGAVAIALGFGSLYNHAPDANATYEEGDDGQGNPTIVVRADRTILAGEEIVIDYTGGGSQPLWFDAV